jgi:hypothetical protein
MTRPEPFPLQLTRAALELARRARRALTPDSTRRLEQLRDELGELERPPRT